MKKIYVFGFGYVGLPTSCLFATHGYQVIGLDTKREVTDVINQGKVPFKEPNPNPRKF